LALIQVLPRCEGALTDRAPGAHHCLLQGATDRQNIHRKDFFKRIPWELGILGTDFFGRVLREGFLGKDFFKRIPWVLSLELISLAGSLREGFFGKDF
jgi:hypothetical protein